MILKTRFTQCATQNHGTGHILHLEFVRSYQFTFESRQTLEEALSVAVPREGAIPVRVAAESPSMQREDMEALFRPSPHFTLFVLSRDKISFKRETRADMKYGGEILHAIPEIPGFPQVRQIFSSNEISRQQLPYCGSLR